jgi:hypothetical protein
MKKDGETPAWLRRCHPGKGLPGLSRQHPVRRSPEAGSPFPETRTRLKTHFFHPLFSQ